MLYQAPDPGRSVPASGSTTGLIVELELNVVSDSRGRGKGEGGETTILRREEKGALPPTREYTQDYKLDLLRRLDLCARPDEVVSLLDAEGIQPSLVAVWRREFDGAASESEIAATAASPPTWRETDRRVLAQSDHVRAKTHITSISTITSRAPGKEACLVLLYGGDLGRKFNLDAATLVLGRSSKCDIQIDQESVSRAHSKIINTGKSIRIRDLGSTNGTYVNDEPIEERVLGDGDLIKIGRTIFKFLSGGNIERAYHEEIYRLTTIDPLTQIYNRRYFLEFLPREFARSTRYRRDLSLMALLPNEIDKLWNVDHDAAESLLQEFASEIRICVRREDLVARYSDRVLVLTLPEIDSGNARSFCDKLIARLSASQHAQLARSTISVGLAGLDGASDASSLLKEVLRRLEAAKRLAGSRIVDYPIPIQEDRINGVFQSTFISYGGPDQVFARKLNDALEIQGVRTFFFHDDAPPGEKLHDVMRTGVNAHDRVILVCSKDSLERPGLLTELEETLARETRDGGATYLLPIRLDDYVIEQWKPKKPGLAQTIRDRVIADFRGHHDPAAFSVAVAKVMAVLLRPCLGKS